jgi:hypothetical protein
MSDQQPSPEEKRILDKMDQRALDGFALEKLEMEKWAAEGSGKPFDQDKELRLRELRLAKEQPLIDLGWRIDYERRGITSPGQIITLADIQGFMDRGDEEGEFDNPELAAWVRRERQPDSESLTVEDLGRWLEELKRLKGPDVAGYRVDREREWIIGPDAFISLGELEEAVAALQPGHVPWSEAEQAAARAAMRRTRHPYDGVFTYEDLVKAVEALHDFEPGEERKPS